MHILILIGLTVVILSIYFIYSKLEKNKVLKRVSMSESEQYAACAELIDGVEKDIVTQAFETLSRIFSVPVEKIRVDDVVGETLGKQSDLSAFETMECEDFYVYIQSRMDEMSVSYKGPINTVIEFVRFEDFIYKSKK